MQHHNDKTYNTQDIRGFIKLLNSEIKLPEKLRYEIEGILINKDHEEIVDAALQELWEETSRIKHSEEEVRADIQKTLTALMLKDSSFPLKPEPLVQCLPLYRRFLFRVAAVLVPFLIVGGVIGLWLSAPEATGDGALVTENQTKVPATITVSATNGDRLLKLADGSTVRLEPGSRLEYSSDFPDTRIVTLTGNAFFTVTKIDGKPFEVLHDELTIRVLGTEFYVDAHGAVTEVTLCSGAVEIQGAGDRVLLEPNQQYMTDCGGAEYTVVGLSEAETARMYRGRLKLRDVSLLEAVEQVAGFFGTEIEVRALTSAESGLIRLEFKANDKLEDVLYILQVATGNAFEYRIEGEKTIIRDR